LLGPASDGRPESLPESRDFVRGDFRSALNFFGIPALSGRSGDAGRLQTASAFSNNDRARFVSFPGFYKNESLQSQWFRQTLRAHNGKRAVDSMQGKDRSDDQK
jgi:hypothetical protein